MHFSYELHWETIRDLNILQFGLVIQNHKALIGVYNSRLTKKISHVNSILLSIFGFAALWHGRIFSRREQYFSEICYTEHVDGDLASYCDKRMDDNAELSKWKVIGKLHRYIP